MQRPDTDLAPISATAGLVWPALPRPEATKALALLYQLEQSQWWPPEVLRERQFWQLQGLLRHAQRTVPFYRERLGAAGIDPTRPLSAETWARIPILTRGELQTSLAALTSRRPPKAHGRTREITTSGSTGKPVKVLGTEVTSLFWRVTTLRNHLWHRRDLSGKLAAIRNVKDGRAGYPRGLRRHNWGSATAGIFRTGPAALLNITTPVDRQVEWLQRQEADYLITFPTNLEALARFCLERDIDLPRLREAQTLGESMAPRVREACREAWDIPVVDMYSSEELGYMALQCPEHEHYHIQAENALVEVLDESGRPCPPGAVGKVIVTHLHNFATPLIRYDLDDYAEVGEACPCGRGLPVLARIMGRVRNMLTLPSGQRFWPSLGDTGYTEVAPVSQLQFVQKTPEHIEVRLVVLRGLTGGEEEKLKELIWSRLGHPFALTFTYLDEIPRSAGGKYEDFVSELAP